MVPFLFKLSTWAGQLRMKGPRPWSQTWSQTSSQSVLVSQGAIPRSSPQFFLQKMETTKTTCCENILDVPLTQAQSLTSTVSSAFLIIWGRASTDTPTLCESFADQHYTTGIQSEVDSVQWTWNKEKLTLAGASRLSVFSMRQVGPNRPATTDDGTDK